MKKYLIVCILAIFLGGLTAKAISPLSIGANIIENSTFDNNDSGWGNYPTKWGQ